MAFGSTKFGNLLKSVLGPKSSGLKDETLDFESSPLKNSIWNNDALKAMGIKSVVPEELEKSIDKYSNIVNVDAKKEEKDFKIHPLMTIEQEESNIKQTPFRTPKTNVLTAITNLGKGLAKAATNINKGKTQLGLQIGEVRKNKIIKILKKDDRTDEEVQSLYEYLKKLFFFKKFVTELVGEGGEAMTKRLISEVTFEEYSANTVLFEENAPSNDKMYVVFSGAFAVYKKKKKNVFEDDYKQTMKRRTVNTMDIYDKIKNSVHEKNMSINLKGKQCDRSVNLLLSPKSRFTANNDKRSNVVSPMMSPNISPNKY